MADKNIRLRISETGADQAARSIGKVDNRLKSLAKTAAAAAAGFFGARMLIQGFRQAVDAAGRQELAERKLETALGRTSKALLDQASALQRVTTVGDEAIIEQQAFLASLEFTEDQIKSIISASLDLSAATGISLESAVRNTAKTFSGLSGELGELIPQLRGLTTEQMKAGDAVKVIADLFGGQAQENTKTMAGAIEQMKNAVGDAAEAVGVVLAPTVIKAANALKGAAEFSSDFLKGLQNLKEFGDTGGLDAVKQKNDESVESYQKLGRALNKYRGLAISLGMDEKKLNKESLFNEEGRLRSRRDQIEFFRQAIDAEVTAQAKSLETAGIAREQEGLKLQNLQEIQLTEEQIAINREAQANSEIAFQNLVLKMQNLQKKNKEEQIKQDLKQAALSQGSARDAMKAVIRAETLEGIAGLISSILKGVPFPLNAILAAGAGAKAASIYDANLSKFALGGDFITDGPQMIMVGDNAGGRERVQVTPLSSPNVNGPQQGVSVNFNAPVTNDEYVRDFIIPEIKKATRMNLA
jgi:hypothetical protein